MCGGRPASWASPPIRSRPASAYSAASSMVSRQRLASSLALRLPQIISTGSGRSGHRQRFDDEPGALRHDEGLHRPAAMRGQAVPEDRDLVPSRWSWSSPRNSISVSSL